MTMRTGSPQVEEIVYGADGLLDRIAGPRNPHPNRVGEDVEKAILDHCLAHPCHGALRVAGELALAGIQEILVVGSKTAQADFRHYVEKHRAALVPFVVGYETVDQPTPNQLVAFARQYFLKFDQQAADPTQR